jgi:hypothetical protein
MGVIPDMFFYWRFMLLMVHVKSLRQLEMKGS